MLCKWRIKKFKQTVNQGQNLSKSKPKPKLRQQTLIKKAKLVYIKREIIYTPETNDTYHFFLIYPKCLITFLIMSTSWNSVSEYIWRHTIDLS